MNEKRASAKAIAAGSLTAFFSSCIASCIFIVIASFMALGPEMSGWDWEALGDPENTEMLEENIERLGENIEMPVFFITVMMFLIWGGFALLGGYIAGRMGKEEPMLNAMWVGGILAGILLLGVLLSLVGGLGTFATLQGIVGMFGRIAMAGAVFFMAWVGGHLARGRGAEEA